MVTAIIVAAGKSERMGGGTDKAFLNLGPKPVVAWSLLAYEKNTDIDRIILVVRKDQLTAAKAVARKDEARRGYKQFKEEPQMKKILALVDSAKRLTTAAARGEAALPSPSWQDALSSTRPVPIGQNS